MLNIQLIRYGKTRWWQWKRAYSKSKSANHLRAELFEEILACVIIVYTEYWAAQMHAMTTRWRLGRIYPI